ncbi:MAG: type VI secretion system baseplate subunit TssE [Gemmataceae bacterium]
MAEVQQGLMPSLLDRLIDPESIGTNWRHGYGIAQMVDVVRRDLEELLNTRESGSHIPEAFVETRNSVLSYGLPDLSTLTAMSAQQREEIGQMISNVVTRHEPRLKDVKATLLNPDERLDQTVRFRIDARMRADPSPDVAFDTILELTTGHTRVQNPG